MNCEVKVYMVVLLLLLMPKWVNAEQSTFKYPVAEDRSVDPNTPVLLRVYQEKEAVPSQLVIGMVADEAVSGDWQLSVDRSTWRFYPTGGFENHRHYNVTVQLDIAGVEKEYAWSFTTRGAVSPRAKTLIRELRANPAILNPEPPNWKTAENAIGDYNAWADYDTTLPSDYDLPFNMPYVHLTTTPDAAPGNVYTTLMPRIWATHPETQLVLKDGKEIVFYNRPGRGYNSFIPHESKGWVTFSEHHFHEVRDTLWNYIEDLNVVGERTHDFHDLAFLDNDHVLLTGLEYMEMDLSSLVPGGNPEAIVIGAIIQELDENRQLYFEWRSLADTTKPRIPEANADVDFTETYVDYMHPNAISFDYDGNLILSNRNQDQVLKIDYITNEVIWQLGGIGGDFIFINEPKPFSTQHDARRALDTGNLIIFDNGGFNHPYARAVEYEIDETNMKATKVWEFDHNREVTSWSRGNASRLPNGNTLIGWGTMTIMGGPQATEVDRDGNIVWEISFVWPDDVEFPPISYRFEKSTMVLHPNNVFLESGLDSLGRNHLFFAKFGDDSVDHYEIYLDRGTVPTSLYRSTSATSCLVDTLEGSYYTRVRAQMLDGSVTGFSETISVEVEVTGVEEPGNETAPDRFVLLSSWPNPFNESAQVSLYTQVSTKLTVTVTNTLGQQVATLHEGDMSQGRHVWVFDGKGLASGTYFLRATLATGEAVTRPIILLH